MTVCTVDGEEMSLTSALIDMSSFEFLDRVSSYHEREEQLLKRCIMEWNVTEKVECCVVKGINVRFANCCLTLENILPTQTLELGSELDVWISHHMHGINKVGKTLLS